MIMIPRVRILFFFYRLRCADDLVITQGVAKTDCGILSDGTCIFYFPFDATDSMLDQSANKAADVSSGTSIVTGCIQRGLLFSPTIIKFTSRQFSRHFHTVD